MKFNEVKITILNLKRENKNNPAQGLAGEVETLGTKTFVFKDHVNGHTPRPIPPKEPAPTSSTMNGTDRKKPLCIDWCKSTSEFFCTG